jgi:lysophospholipase L1-like esterase
MSIEVNKTDRIVNVTVEKKYGKSIEADIDIAGQRVGFKQEGETNFTYIDLPKLEFNDLSQAQKDSLKLTFDQLTQAEKDSLKGSDANVTSENIATALGYTPANDSEVVKGILNPDGSERVRDINGKVKLPDIGKELETEGKRLDSSLTSIYAWGDSLTAGAGGTPYPTTLSNLTDFTVTNKGFGGETSTQIKSKLVADWQNYSKSVIIWVGRNNYTDPETVKADISEMLSYIGHTRYLVVSILNGGYEWEYSGSINYNTITQLNNDLRVTYGDKYVELREYLISNHDGSPQDLIDVENDIVPSSLRSDNIHLNTAGYTLTAEFLNKKLGVLFNQTDFLQSKDLAYYAKENAILRNPSVRQENTSFYINGSGRLQKIITQSGTADNDNAAHWMFQTNFANRISFVLTELEEGGDSGSNLSLITHNDSGLVKHKGLTFFRDSGSFVFHKKVDLNGGATATDPVNPTDVANKDYVDNKVSGASGSYTTADGKTVTVTDGIITSIV